MTRNPVGAPEGICQNCGRVEISSTYCTYCYEEPFTGIILPTAVDVAAVRYELVRLHGWKSPALCDEIRRHPARVIGDAYDAGFVVRWPLP